MVIVLGKPEAGVTVTVAHPKKELGVLLSPGLPPARFCSEVTSIRTTLSSSTRLSEMACLPLSSEVVSNSLVVVELSSFLQDVKTTAEKKKMKV